RMLHKNIVVVDKGAIEGKGLLVNNLIKKDEVVFRLEPNEPTYLIVELLKMTPEEQEKLTHYAYQTDEDVMTSVQGDERYMNHSCDPNTIWIDDDTLIASRDIQPGEEATYDYATAEVKFPFAMECHCGSPNCRKAVTNFDYRDPAWQAKYGKMLPRHTLKAIAEWNASVATEKRT
ncbi:hypothetical protein FO519_010364, partial [Halicephalobus sp. NKZ332]